MIFNLEVDNVNYTITISDKSIIFHTNEGILAFIYLYEIENNSRYWRSIKKKYPVICNFILKHKTLKAFI